MRGLRPAAWVVAAVCTSLAAFVAGLLAAPVSFDPPAGPRPALLYAADGTTPLGTVRPVGQREPVPLAQVPVALRHAVVAVQDERFARHAGLDPVGALRSTARRVAGLPGRDGPTLTQSYLRSIRAGEPRTALHRVREAVDALRLERTRSKDEILAGYLNAVDLGDGTYGVQPAARHYFGVDVADLALDPATGTRSTALELARAALLAGITADPSASPLADPEAARDRQRAVLNRMVETGVRTSAQASAAYGLAVEPVRAGTATTSSPAGAFTELLAARLAASSARPARAAELFRGGRSVTTTLEPALQDRLQHAVAAAVPDAGDAQVAAVVLADDGNVRALTTLRAPAAPSWESLDEALRQAGLAATPRLWTAIRSGPETARPHPPAGAPAPPPGALPPGVPAGMGSTVPTGTDGGGAWFGGCADAGCLLVWVGYDSRPCLDLLDPCAALAAQVYERTAAVLAGRG